MKTLHWSAIAPTALSCALSISAPCGAGSRASPTVAVAEAYRSYVSNVMPIMGGGHAAAEAMWQRRWLTPRFRAAFGGIIESTDADPIVKAQDSCQAWATDIETVLVSANRGIAVVTVALGAHLRSAKRLSVTLRLRNDGWKVDSVADEGGEPVCS